MTVVLILNAMGRFCDIAKLALCRAFATHEFWFKHRYFEVFHFIVDNERRLEKLTTHVMYGIGHI